MDIGMVILRVVVLIFSVVFHECAHGWAALKLGDTTARDMGRLTLNPVPHIDPMGSIILPLVLGLTGSPIMLAWAKPVPVRVDHLEDPLNDHPKVALAGPMSNLLLALICAVVMGLMQLVLGFVVASGGTIQFHQGSPLYFLFMVLEMGILLNVVLAVFNLLPLPPLDGSWILSRFLPPVARLRFENLRRYGFLPILVFLLAVNYTFVGKVYMQIIFGTYGFFHRIAGNIGTLFG